TCLCFLSAPSPTGPSTLSLHDALPICGILPCRRRLRVYSKPVPKNQAKPCNHREPRHSSYSIHSHFSSLQLCAWVFFCGAPGKRSEEHTSELQSRFDLVCRLLLEKKKE